MSVQQSISKHILEIINISGLDITIIKSKQVTKELGPHAAISIIKCIS